MENILSSDVKEGTQINTRSWDAQFANKNDVQ